MEPEDSLTWSHEQNTGPYTEPHAVWSSLKVHSPSRKSLLYEAQSYKISDVFYFKQTSECICIYQI
jgi:hypothetical protein